MCDWNVLEVPAASIFKEEIASWQRRFLYNVWKEVGVIAFTII
jgi:hypothetical protein